MSEEKKEGAQAAARRTSARLPMRRPRSLLRRG